MSSEFDSVSACQEPLGLSSKFADMELICMPEKGPTSQLSTRKA